MAISYRYRHFPGAIIQHAVWLYGRFALSLRDVEDLLAERGIELSYETIRRWVARYGPEIAKKLRRQRARAHPRWHLDEMFVAIGGRRIASRSGDCGPHLGWLRGKFRRPGRAVGHAQFLRLGGLRREY